MKNKLFFVLLFVAQLVFAQFTENDVKYFVGTGDQTAYVVVDFKDGTDDRSYAWGVRYNSGENLAIFNLLQKIQADEPAFTFQGTGFLQEITFNSHTSVGRGDYWSTWTGNSAETFAMNGGMSGTVNNGKWYGMSYGFSNPTNQAPVTPIPAYSSNWFPMATSVTNWIGTGSNKSVVVVDFGTDSNGVADSFAFGIQYNGTITAEQALQLIANQNPNFTFTVSGNTVSAVSLNSYSGTNSASDTWKLFNGTNLSNWKTQSGLSGISLSNNGWLGLSFGKRRPFTPQEASLLSVNSVDFSKNIKIFPNPATDFIQIQSDERIISTSVYNLAGQKVLESKEKTIDIKHIPSGTYILDLTTNKGKKSFKVIKK